MSRSLHRSFSLACAESTTAPFSLANGRVIPRKSHIPIVPFCKSTGLPKLPRSPKFGPWSPIHGPLPRVAPSAQKHDDCHRKIESYRSMPSRPTVLEDNHCIHDDPEFFARGRSSVDAGESVVYRDLSESLRRNEVPSLNECLLRHEGVSRSSADVKRDSLSAPMEQRKLQLDADATGRPVSLRILKRNISSKAKRNALKHPGTRQMGGIPRLNFSEVKVPESGGTLLSNVTASVGSAFSSILFMMNSLQEHTLRVGRALNTEADVCIQMMIKMVQQDMQETFLWLFGKVFACTPKLMLLTMLLLVNFATHSMREHVAHAVMFVDEPSTSMEQSISVISSIHEQMADAPVSNSFASKAVHLHESQGSPEPQFSEGGSGGGVVRIAKVGGAMDGESAPGASTERPVMTTEDDAYRVLNDTTDSGYASFLSDFGASNRERVLQDTCSIRKEQSKSESVVEPNSSEELNSWPLSINRHMMVAPVHAPALEADDYACYDRTDLNYQDELSKDPNNPLILANYAQFLHVVRHDHDRAEKVYKRAVNADPVDGEVIGKYASFLWVAKDDVEGADEAFKAAVAADPSNVYHAGSYAHFLWSSGAEDEDVSVSSSFCHQVSTS
ncbi:hypothetical protein KP509_23G051100 [Ceratopteris richardii]|uniref:Uncharacterized protein n=1 Tax=Ceratopteris richardii TaxID=49495 RepID=A0A8T2S2V6_CERRI|nr:hypothetical protein KP509_23G051100 [Ceratopteris richardii]